MTHYIYGSGEHGCLYDNGPHYAETLNGAVSALADLFGLGQRRRAALKRDLYIELNPQRDGVDFAEISECACSDPKSHQDD